MNCKNCQTELKEQSKFCDECGAKVIRDRITFRKLLADLVSNVFGWDNKYLYTIKTLVIKPDVIFGEYINGTRKKYVNPFTFFAISLAIIVLVFNTFSDEYLIMSSQLSENQTEIVDQALIDNTDEPQNEEFSDSKQEQIEMNTKVQEMILKYYNISSFAVLPIYALIAYLVFGKPYNYGEHLVINAYIQGLSFLLLMFFFIISLFTTPSVYFSSMILGVGYYSFAYGKLYQLSFGKTIVKFLKFIGILLIFIFVFIGISILIGYILGLIFK